jgi:hypothetical protein
MFVCAESDGAHALSRKARERPSPGLTVLRETMRMQQGFITS